MRERLSRLGAALGNWNDRRHYAQFDGLEAAPRRWTRIDRIASWLYTLPDRRKRQKEGGPDAH